MKKTLKVLSCIGLWSLPLMILAEGIPGASPAGNPANNVKAPSLDVFSLINAVINWMFYGLLFAAAIAIMIAAYYFITAQGDSDKTKTARNFVLYAVIGVLVGFAAKGIILLMGVISGNTTSTNIFGG